MDLLKLLVLIKKHNLSKYVIEWAGVFRYLGSQESGFTLEKWQSLITIHIHENLAKAILNLLVNMELVNFQGNRYSIVNDIQLQRTFEAIDTILEIYPEDIFKEKENLLWTEPIGNISIPQKISSQFNYLNLWVQNLIQTTKQRLIFFAPYYSVAGISHLKISLDALLNAKPSVKIDWIVSDVNNLENAKAIEFVRMNFFENHTSSVRIFCISENEQQQFDFHAKLLLSDREKGYLGSANFSKRGLGTQFELGVVLDKHQTNTLTDLIDFWILNELLTGVEI